jgi:Ion channel
MMQEQIEKRRDLLLLLSLLLVILIHPVLDHGMIRRLVLMALTFVPLVLATIKMSKRKGWVWPLAFLISGTVICGVGGTIFSNELLLVLQWILVTFAFGVSVIGLFSYLQEARTVTSGHLYTAASIYLLIGISWFTLYSAIEKVYPGSFLQTTTGSTNRPTDLLYFSLVTLTTLGYGDILPGSGEVRILAALEAGVGVLYVAITVALLVSGYKQRAQG